MKKIILLSFLLTLPIFPQQWVKQHEIKYPYEQAFKVVVANDNVWFINNLEQIWVTKNGGLSFEKIFGEPNQIILNIYYYNNKLIVIFRAGDMVYFIASNDYGSSFKEIKGSIFAPDIRNIIFTDEMHGFGIDYYRHRQRDLFSKTTNGGGSWILANASGISSLHFMDSLNGIMFSESTNYIRRTSDAGLTWHNKYFPDSISHMQAIFYPLDSAVYILGRNTNTSKYRYDYTLDTFELALDVPFAVGLITFMNKKDNVIIISSPYSKILDISIDYGLTWEKRYAPDLNIFNYIFLSDGTVVAMGDNGSIHKSNNLALSWNYITYPLMTPTRIFFLDENNGWIVGSNIMKTSNGGKDWELIYTKGFSWTTCFVNKYKGFVYSYENFDAGYFLKTTDGGYNWDTLFASSQINDIYFVDSLTGFAVGDSTFLKTEDGGETWFRDPSCIGNDIQFCSTELGFIASNFYGFKTVDGGKSWIKDNNLWGNKIFFLDSKTSFKATGTSIRKTTDGGLTFNIVLGVTEGNIYSLSDVQFVNDSVGYAIAGNNEIIWKTTDKGNNWEFSFEGYGYFPFYFLKENLGWTAGVYGEIWKYTDEVTTFVQNENVVYNFSLSQNYPNPFNPSTTIKYSIPKQNIVSLKIYDVLGNEVDQIVNEEKPAGEYEANFNASGLSSGVYFYRINSGEFSQVKKLLLLK
ncbi:MAG TPA: T9SS type A sorting domain-containing protein [Ignavibacteriaceae bacterium]|nr:T9SS type A sorting domain-containing protein [Ignavibacteriaceae bacterium]